VPVWDPVVRIAHWILATCIIAAWFTRGATHDWLGYGALGVVALRLLWGWVGPRHAHFGEFVRSTAATLAYARAVVARAEPRYLGHNPLGAWMIVALLAMIALVAGTGWLSTTDRFWGVEWLQETHHLLADALLVLATLHVAGVAYTSLRHRENLVRAMITGRKPPPRAGDVFE